MKSILIHPKNKTELKAIKAFARALNLEFESQESECPYNPEFVEMILQGREDVKNGKGVKIAIEDLWK